VLASGQVDRIGQAKSEFTLKTTTEHFEQQLQVKDHLTAVQLVIEQLLAQKVIANMTEISGVGHRISNGGDYYQQAVIIDEQVEQRIDEMAVLSPLHNPVNLLGIKAFKQILPETMQVAVFDTAFNASIPKENALYALPYEYYEKHGIRKYGFHGPSHQYVTEQIQAQFPEKSGRIISCHLGSGASISAIQDGQTIDNSMGFTPLAGLVMGTRSGDIDPQIVPYMEQQLGLDAAGVKEVLNAKSGLLGISGYSSDIRDLEEAAEAGNERAALALKMFVHRIQTYIGSYVAELNGVDTIVFTAGIGEHDDYVRAEVMKNFSYLGIQIDAAKNATNELVISQPDSPVQVLVIPTDEEIVIARDVYRHQTNH
jgi:acetate kinase